MEADSKESQELKMDPEAIRKPLRARKTMTPSSRKQVEILKNLHGLGRAGNSTYSVDNYLQLKMIETECLNRYSTKETDPELQSKKLSAKEPVAKLVVNSEISIYDGSPDVSRDLPYNSGNTDTNVTLQDLLLTLYEKESSSPISKPVEVHLYSKQSSRPLDGPKELTSSLSSDVPASSIAEKRPEPPGNSAAAVLKHLRDNFQFRGESELSDDSLGEKKTSDHEEEVSCQHITSSVETGVASTTQPDKSQSGLEKVRCLIQSHVDDSLGGLDRKLQQLNLRIDHTQCLRKHEEITIQIIKKISRLDKHVKSVVDFQRVQLSKKVNPPSEQPKATILNVSRSLSGNPHDPAIPSKRRSAQPGEVPSKTVKSSAKETCCDVQTSSVQDSNPAVSTDAQQKEASSQLSHVSTEAPSAPKKFLIDLTEEEDTNAEVSAKANPPPDNATSKIPPPTTEPSVEFPHLPPLPEIGVDPPHVNSSKDTLPPQKLEVEVVQIKNPKGFALQWNIKKVDPRCAPIDSFHLFICHENNGMRSPWTKTNEITALPLPMACSISQVATSGKCYFAMQSKDIFGRFGPFCDIQSISALGF